MLIMARSSTVAAEDVAACVVTTLDCAEGERVNSALTSSSLESFRRSRCGVRHGPSGACDSKRRIKRATSMST